ncbi:MAG TPA: ferric reductase-like transmembrane domain-containing protein [Actinomycetota bacterium]|jgi:methionine sulfoxide reductase heme-binding subunit
MNAALGDTRALWFLTRGSGAVTLLLLTGTVVLGIANTARWASPAWPRFVTERLHRNLSLLALVFLALHVATAVVDGYAPIGWLDALLPFGSAYRPLWLGLGALAGDLLLAVLVTSLLRARIGHDAWRAVHWLAYACWPVAFAHGLGTGSDPGRAWMLAVEVVAAAAVLAAGWWRLGVAPGRWASPAGEEVGPHGRGR